MGEILNAFKSKGFLASCLSTYDLSILKTTLPHDLIKEKGNELIEQIFDREGTLNLACKKKRVLFLLLNNLKDIIYGHARKIVTSYVMLWSIYFKDLTRNCIGKLKVFQKVLSVLLWLHLL